MSPKFIKMGLGGTGFLGKPCSHERAAKRRANRRRVLDGFPIDRPFESIKEVREYLSGDKIVCLLCGRSFRTLGLHLRKIHDMTPDEYRERYNIPWTYGLACAENREAHSVATKKLIASGYNPGTDDRDFLAGLARAPKRDCPHKGEICQENVQKYNESRPPPKPKPKPKPRPKRKPRPKPAKFGSPEHREKLRQAALKRSNETSETFSKYWKGRKQSPEHLAKRMAAQQEYLIRTGKKRPEHVHIETLPCRMCGKDVDQPAAGRKYYCSTHCRSQYYDKKKHASEATCGLCGSTFTATGSQMRRASRGLPVYCSFKCRQTANGRGRTRKVDTEEGP